MISIIDPSLAATCNVEQLVADCLAHDVRLRLPAYSQIEADAVFHNISVEQVIVRYLLAKLREVSSVQ